jgi:hypothetical protein
VFDGISEIIQRLGARLRALAAPTRRAEVTRALEEDAATRAAPADDSPGSLPNDDIAQRARAAADAALRARRQRD